METQTAWQISSKEYSMWSKDNFIYENTGKNALCERNRWTEETWGKISSIQHSIGNWLERLYKAYFVIQLSLVFSFQDTEWSVSEGKKSNDFRRGLRSPHWQVSALSVWDFISYPLTLLVGCYALPSHVDIVLAWNQERCPRSLVISLFHRKVSVLLRSLRYQKSLYFMLFWLLRFLQ